MNEASYPRWTLPLIIAVASPCGEAIEKRKNDRRRSWALALGPIWPPKALLLVRPKRKGRIGSGSGSVLYFFLPLR